MKSFLPRLLVVLINLALVIAGSELLFTAYYYTKDGRYQSVADKLAAEKSSFDVEKTSEGPCNRHHNVLIAHPYLAFVHTSRPECNALANNTGHRGPDVPYHKNPDDYVVMMLGGSVAHQLYQFEHEQLQTWLQKKHPDKHVIVLNGALEGWKQPQQLFMLQLYGDVIDAAFTVEGANEVMFNRRLNYNVRFDAPFLAGFRKANPQYQSDAEQRAMVLSSWIFDTLQDNAVLSHSKTAYFIGEQWRAHLAIKALAKNDLDQLGQLRTIYELPKDWSFEQKRSDAIAQYIKYLGLMNATAKQYHIRFAIFLQPVPALNKPLSADEQAVVGDLNYRDDYQLFTNELLNPKNNLPIVSLVNVFDGVNETIYKDSIHYLQESSGPGRVITRIEQTLDTKWQ